MGGRPTEEHYRQNQVKFAQDEVRRLARLICSHQARGHSTGKLEAQLVEAKRQLQMAKDRLAELETAS